MKKKLIAIILAAGLLTGCGKHAQLKNGQDPFMELGDGTVYSVDDVWKEMKDNYALSVSLDMVDKKILEEELKDKKKDIKEYIDNYETSLKANYVDEDGNFDEDAMNSALANYGYNSVDLLLDNQKISYMKKLVTTDYVKTLVTDKELKNYYKDEVVGDINCVHILVKPKSEETNDLTDARLKAEEIIDAIKKDVKSGTSAKDAFAKYKDDKKVTYQDLSYFNKGDMQPEFEEAAYKLKVGKFSTTPVKTSYGYHVILKLDEKEKESLKKLTDEIKTTLAEKKISEDSTLNTTAMGELRKKYGLKWKDSDVEETYNKYMNYMVNKKEDE